MNNTDRLEKKIDALIDALGFEVETTEDIKHFYKQDDIAPNGELKVNAFPDSTIKTVDYKVTKRGDEVLVPFAVYTELLIFISEHINDINDEINDFVLLEDSLAWLKSEGCFLNEKA